MVLHTGAILFEADASFKLDTREKLITRYGERYGIWPRLPVIYQADVRARLEQVERIRRRWARGPCGPARQEGPPERPPKRENSGAPSR